jgi:alpha-tubulin suppressor-like RCC1 family protein
MKNIFSTLLLSLVSIFYFQVPLASATGNINIQSNPLNFGGVAVSTTAQSALTIHNLVPEEGLISVGQSEYVCMVTAAGGVKCWGGNNAAQLGDGTTVNKFIPTDVVGLTSGVKSVTTGNSHACALMTAGTVKCWGFNTNGQVGDGTTVSPRYSPVNVIGLANVVQITAAGAHTCAVLSDHSAKCWGANNFGQLGDGTLTERNTPTTVSGFTNNVASIDASDNGTCVVTVTGGAKCWGNNSGGQLGNNTTTNSSIPVDVTGLTSGVLQISAALDHTCAITTAGGAKCWGGNTNGKLGDGTTTTRLTPVDVSGLTSGVAKISAGRNHTCAITTAGGAKCWGTNTFGQIGDSTAISPRLTPTNVTGLSTGVTAISTNFHTTCASTTSGVKCWGYNSVGELGDGTVTTRSIPAALSGNPAGAAPSTPGILTVNSYSTISGFDASQFTLASGGTCPTVFSYTLAGGASCTLFIDFSPTTTGAKSASLQINSSDTLNPAFTENLAGVGIPAAGTGLISVSPNPLNISGTYVGTTVQGTVTIYNAPSINSLIAESRAQSTCMVTATGGVKCWGDNSGGQLGNGTLIATSTPTDVTGLSSGVVSIATGQGNHCALMTNGTIKCWGDNTSGKLGDGTTIRRLTPITVSGITNAIQITAGTHFTCAVLADRSAKCWGGNNAGQLGDGTTTDRPLPTTVAGFTNNIASISAGEYFTCALTITGGVKCWGTNGNGALGDGTPTGVGRPTPADVLGLTSGVKQISSGSNYACAVATAGGAKCWGWNAAGTIGDNTITTRLSPVDVTGLTSGVASISAGNTTTCVITTTGGAKCWGNNAQGQVGDGTLTNRLTAVDVSGLAANVAGISTNLFSSCAILNTGEVKCWGYNSTGQLGDGTLVQRTSPVSLVGSPSGALAQSSGPLTITSYSAMAGTDASQFAIASGGTCSSTFNYTLSVGASCTLNIGFTPASAGSKSANFTINSSDQTTPAYTVNITGVLSAIPGGAAGGMILWNKADAGITTSGANITGWADQTGGNTFSITGTPQISTALLNFNPMVQFNGSSRFSGNTTIANQTEFFAVGKIVNTTPVNASGALIGSTAVTTNQYQFHTEGGALYSAGNANAVLNNTTALGNNVGPVIFNNDLSETAGVNQKLKINGLPYTNNVGGDPIPYSTIPTIGSRGTENLLNGSQIAEVIIYNASKSTGTERQRIISYLAAKYGITLDQTTPQNYLASDATIVWNATTNAAYNKNITVIGRDSAEDLNQKQSKSINTSALVTVGRGSINTSNASNTDTFAVDKSYFAFGDDNGALTWSQTGAPVGRQILGRKFKAQSTNFAETVKLTVPDDSATITTKLPAEVGGNVYLLVDTDGDGNFTTGTVQETAMTFDSVKKEWDPAVTIPDGAVFTFATAVQGITVSTTTLSVAENAGTANFTVVLNVQPASNVVLNVTSTSTANGLVSPATLTFTTTNWNTPQTVTVTSVNDNIISTDTSNIVVSVVTASSDPAWALTTNKAVLATFIDDDAPGFIILATDNTTDEDLSTGTFTIVMKSQPTVDVTVPLSSSNTSEGTVQTSVTFTPTNWNLPQIITVTGIDDAIPTSDGAIVYSIVTGAPITTDVNYGALTDTSIADIFMVNQDNDAPGIVVNALTTTTSESGGTTVVQFRLLAQPAGGADVTIPLSVSNSGEASLSASSITILNTNWNTPSANQITVTGVDDTVADGTISYQLITGLPVTTDPAYTTFTAANVADITLNNLDNDIAGVTITQTVGSTDITEGGSTDTYSLVLNTQPTANVIVNINGGTQANVSSTSITFTTANWNIAQTITVTAMDDTLYEGAHTGTISHTSTSADIAYNGVIISDIIANITDNDTVPDLGTPTVTVNKAVGQASTTGTSTILFTAIFSEAIDPASLSALDFNLNGTGAGSVTSATTTDNILGILL